MSLLQQKKPYFLTQAPPPGYVPGVGRGYVSLSLPVFLNTPLQATKVRQISDPSLLPPRVPFIVLWVL